MRVSKEQAVINRNKIVWAAAKLFNERGYDAVGLTELMKEAGFTHGGFYNHFASKEALAVEAYKLSFINFLKSMTSKFEVGSESAEEILLECLYNYLSPDQRDNPSYSYPSATFVADAMGRDENVQGCYADGIEACVDLFMNLKTKNRASFKRNEALAILTTVIGATVLSKALVKGSESLSDEVLESARERLNSICKVKAADLQFSR
ncbi:TetR/AcrR family transcriptional regulator [Pseudomonas chlororaphis]|uniref:HTH tetR-type domain-containing protein n=1 Tax=Pseudomonas chlororaphis TaxID=587753 RepID=A0A1Q8EU88_9PSED|nr:TetR/AcrR family transcriptional regulator [Pseudomonas chlororaphis]OLF55366.1 hypothetical protein BTN82_07200 [Pseudomonas chlororaphis]